MTFTFQRANLGVLLLSVCALAGTPLYGQSISERLVIHGYLTQGYATTSGEPLLGIPNDGTFDYRRVALLLRFKGTPNDAFVVQLANRRLGESLINDFTPDVQLDWAFYERRLGDNTLLRIGKAPIPMGISNETRFLGTVLPFYRVPFGFYQEGGFTSETLNGFVLTRKLNPGSKWMVTGAVFGGEFDYLQAASSEATDSTPAQYVIAPARARNLIGAQFWLQTPLTGLRVGAGAARREDEGVITEQIAGAGATKDVWGSVDGSFDRLVARAEYRRLAFGTGGAIFRTYYGQVGYRILESLLLTVQRDVTDLDVPIPQGRMTIPYSRDNGIGVAYTFAPNVVGKLEYHDSDGFDVEAPVNFSGPALQNRYVITSISVSF
jgi:hypothetical protein